MNLRQIFLASAVGFASATMFPAPVSAQQIAAVSITPFHLETGKGTRPKVVKFQLRPDPLAR
jgi:hypothetical protein